MVKSKSWKYKSYMSNICPKMCKNVLEINNLSEFFKAIHWFWLLHYLNINYVSVFRLPFIFCCINLNYCFLFPFHIFFFKPTHTQSSTLFSGCPTLKRHAQPWPGRAEIELNSLSSVVRCLQPAVAYREVDVKHNSIWVGKWKHEVIAHDLMLLFLLHVWTIHRTPIFLGNSREKKPRMKAS